MQHVRVARVASREASIFLWGILQLLQYFFLIMPVLEISRMPGESSWKLVLPLKFINISWKHKIETIRNSQKEKISFIYKVIKVWHKYVNTVEFAFFRTPSSVWSIVILVQKMERSKHALQVFPFVVSKKLWQGRGRGRKGGNLHPPPPPATAFSSSHSFSPRDIFLKRTGTPAMQVRQTQACISNIHHSQRCSGLFCPFL